MENSERKELIIDEMEADMKAMKFFITKQACIPY